MLEIDDSAEDRNVAQQDFSACGRPGRDQSVLDTGRALGPVAQPRSMLHETASELVCRADFWVQDEQRDEPDLSGQVPAHSDEALKSWFSGRNVMFGPK